MNVSEQIRQVIALLDKRWSAKDITVAFDCGEHFVVGNKELLKQVWINLADNAIKFSPEHETVEISIRETPAALVISFCEQKAMKFPLQHNRIFLISFTKRILLMPPKAMAWG